MAHIAQLAAGVVALAVQARVGIGFGLVGVVAALFAFEVAAVTVAPVVVILAHEALVASPGLDQRAVHAEVLAREPFFLVRDGLHFVEEFDDGIVLDQAFAVFGEDRGHPHSIVHGQPDKPAEQQVVLDLLHQLTFRTDAVQHLKQHGAQQLFRSDAGTAAFDVGLVHLSEQAVHLFQRRIGHLADDTQRVVRRNEVLQLTHGEQAFGKGVGAAH